MKILHELNQLEMGGAERVVLGIIKHDQKNKHLVYTYKDGPMRELLETAGAEVIVDKPNESPNLDIDLIHIHTGGEESVVANSVKGLIPTIETVHSPVVSKVRDEYVMKRVGVSGVVSKMNRKCVTVHNGIDFTRLENDYSKEECKINLGIHPEAFVIGRLGRIGTDKCLEEFLAACYRFQTTHPTINSEILICGGEAKNDKGYLAKVKVMAASLPLRNVHFVGETNEVAHLYTAMDVFLYPSPTEGFGLVVAEAMACETAVVIYDNELNKELFMGGALLVDSTVQGLVNGLYYLWQSKEIREQLAAEGQLQVINHFQESRMSEEYQAIYETLVPQENRLVAV